MQMRDGVLFETACLGDLVRENEGPRGVRQLFSSSKSYLAGHSPPSPAAAAWPTKWTHKTSQTETIHAVPDSYLIRNINTTKNYTDQTWKKHADDAWNRRGLLHITEKVQIDLARVFAVTTDSGFISSAWHSFVPKPELGCDAGEWSKAMAVYLNSTLGIIAMLGVRTSKKLSYPRWGVDNVQTIPVPILNNNTTKRIDILTTAYEKFADQNLGLLGRPTSARGGLDKAVEQALDVPDDLIATMRLELSNEPMVTARQYHDSAILC